MVTFRTDTWQNMTQGVGQNYLLNSTGVTNTGGSDTAQMISAFMNVGMGVAATAIAAKAQNSQAAGSAQTTNAMSISTNANMLVGTTSQLIADYEAGFEELEELNARKAQANNLQDLQAKVDNVDTAAENNKVNQEKYKELDDNVNNLTDLKRSADTIEKEITKLQISANVQIDKSLPNSYVTITDPMNAVNEVKSAKAKYGEGDAFNSVAFEQDKNKAMEIQQAAVNKKIAQTNLDDKQKELANLKNSPGGNLIQGDVSLSSIEQAIKSAELERDQFAVQNSYTDKNGNTVAISVHQNNVSQLNQAKQDAGNKDLDSAIKTKTAELKAKKTSLDAQKSKLVNLKTQLTTLRDSMQSTLDEQTQAEQVKTAKDNYNDKNDKRGFFKKLFGTGKSDTQKANEKSYKKEKAEAKAAQKNFTQAFSFKADEAGLKLIKKALKNVEAQIDKIGELKVPA